MSTDKAFDQAVITAIKEKSALFSTLTNQVSKIIVGQQEAITFIELAILASGHILLEGVPGVAKTTIIKAVNKALGLSFSRIQFTPDLLPADVIGTVIYNPKTHEFLTKKGPIFANFILADEINRAPAKVQSALLEAMQEQQVTIGSETFTIETPFLVCATQNPIEQEGTYRLPEAQVDRFMFKITVKYPDKKQERELLEKSLQLDEIHQVVSIQDIFESQQLIAQLYIDDKIKDYIVAIIFATRDPKSFGFKDITNYIQYGASPRATLAICQAAKAYAFLKGRHFVIPDDVKFVAPAILRHRIVVSYDAESEGVTSDALIHKILSLVPTP